MTRLTTVIGGILVVIGAVWIGQGLGYIGGSFMTGQSHWAWIGAASALLGMGLIFMKRRR